MSLRETAAKALALFTGRPPASTILDRFDVDGAEIREEQARTAHEAAVQELEASRTAHEAAVQAYDQAGDDDALDRAHRAKLRVERAERLECAARLAASAALVQFNHTRAAARFLAARQGEHEADAAELAAAEVFEINLDALLAAVTAVTGAARHLDNARERRAAARLATDGARAQLATIDPQLAATAPRIGDPERATYDGARPAIEHTASAAAQLVALAERVAERARELVEDQRQAAEVLGTGMMSTAYAAVALERAGYRAPRPTPDATRAPYRHVNMLAMGVDTDAASASGLLSPDGPERSVEALLRMPAVEARAELFPASAAHGRPITGLPA